MKWELASIDESETENEFTQKLDGVWIQKSTESEHWVSINHPSDWPPKPHKANVTQLSDFEIFGGGGNGPDHLRVVSPGQRPRDRSTLFPALVFAFLRVRLRLLSFFARSVLYITMVSVR